MGVESSVSKDQMPLLLTDNLQVHLKTLYEFLSDAIVVADSDWDIVGVNPAFTTIFGYDEHEVIGCSMRLLYANGDDFTKTVQLHYDKGANSRSEWQEELFRRKDGSVFWSESTGVPATQLVLVHRDESGQPQYLLTIIRDISEQNRFETELMRSVNRYQGVLHNMMDAYWRIDSDGRIVEANASICKMHGYSISEILQMSVSDFEVIESFEETQRHIEAVRKEGQHLFESKHRCRDGRTIELEISANLSADEPRSRHVPLRCRPATEPAVQRATRPRRHGGGTMHSGGVHARTTASLGEQ